MLFWYGALTVVLVAWIFASPALDYRVVAVGAVLPVVERIAGGPWALHTLAAPVLTMTLVMVGFRGQRLRQRRWLGLPIGLFFHLVLDGTWARTALFWWPAFGVRVPSDELPGDRSWPLMLALEAVGVAVAVVFWRQQRLGVDGRWERLVRTGQLPRD